VSIFVYLKTSLPKVGGTGFLEYTKEREEQYRNAPSPIEVALLGIVTDVRDEQP
jgi:hypothetical protein